MAETPSTMLALGTPLPSFALPDLTGKTILSDDFRSAPAMLVAFICPHCPYVRHIRSVFAQFASEYAARGLKVVAINANDAQQFPDDGPEGMRQEAREVGYTFPDLYDEAQEVAKAFHAPCTPDFVPLRPRRHARVSRPVRRQSSRNRRARYRQRPACRGRRGARRPASRVHADAEHRLQH